MNRAQRRPLCVQVWETRKNFSSRGSRRRIQLRRKSLNPVLPSISLPKSGTVRKGQIDFFCAQRLGWRSGRSGISLPRSGRVSKSPDARYHHPGSSSVFSDGLPIRLALVPSFGRRVSNGRDRQESRIAVFHRFRHRFLSPIPGGWGGEAGARALTGSVQKKKRALHSVAPRCAAILIHDINASRW